MAEFEQLYWRAFLRVNSKEKANKIITLVAKALDTECFIDNCNKYWKDESLYEVCFHTKLNLNEVDQTVFNILLKANKIAYNWYVSGPTQFENLSWEFSGIADKSRISGLEWVEFRVSSDKG